MIQKPMTFGEDTTPFERSLQIWLILIGLAANRQTITYGELAERMGYHRNLAPRVDAPLNFIGEYCRQQENMPILPAIVVAPGTGLPREGIMPYLDREQLNSEREKVYAYHWFMAIPPTPSDFEKAHQQAG